MDINDIVPVVLQRIHILIEIKYIPIDGVVLVQIKNEEPDVILPVLSIGSWLVYPICPNDGFTLYPIVNGAFILIVDEALPLFIVFDVDDVLPKFKLPVVKLLNKLTVELTAVDVNVFPIIVVIAALFEVKLILDILVEVIFVAVKLILEILSAVKLVLDKLVTFTLEKLFWPDQLLLEDNNLVPEFNDVVKNE